MQQLPVLRLDEPQIALKNAFETSANPFNRENFVIGLPIFLTDLYEGPEEEVQILGNGLLDGEVLIFAHLLLTVLQQPFFFIA